MPGERYCISMSSPLNAKQLGCVAPPNSKWKRGSVSYVGVLLSCARRRKAFLLSACLLSLCRHRVSAHHRFSDINYNVTTIPCANLMIYHSQATG